MSILWSVILENSLRRLLRDLDLCLADDHDTVFQKCVEHKISDQELLELTDESMASIDMPEGTKIRFKKARENYLKKQAQKTKTEYSKNSSAPKNEGINVLSHHNYIYH